jgi:hypothetical protein
LSIVVPPLQWSAYSRAGIPDVLPVSFSQDRIAVGHLSGDVGHPQRHVRRFGLIDLGRHNDLRAFGSYREGRHRHARIVRFGDLYLAQTTVGVLDRDVDEGVATASGANRRLPSEEHRVCFVSGAGI